MREIRWSRQALPLVGAILLAALLVAGWSFARREMATRIALHSAELEAVTELKALQLAEWHRERVDDALGRAADPFLIASTRAWLSGQQSAEREAQLRGALTPRREPWRYLNVWLLDLRGRAIFDARRLNIAADLEPGLLEECVQARRPVFGILRNISTPAPFIDICMAVIDLTNPNASPEAVEVYRADASQLLLPTINFWPRSNLAAVTTLIRFDGESAYVVVSSASLALPGTSPVVIPTGFISPSTRDRTDHDVIGLDGRRRLVVSATVPNTPWTLVAAVERGVALRDGYSEIVLGAVLIIALGIMGFLSVVVLLGRRDRSAAKHIMRLDRLLQVRSGINEAIVRIRDRNVMLSRFCELAVSPGRFALAVVYEWQHERQAARLIASYGKLPHRLTTGQDIAVDDTVRRGPLGPLFDSGGVAIVPDLLLEPPTPWTDVLIADGHRAVVALPIREGEQVAGSFWMYSSEPGTFDHRDLQFFDELAADINYALENVKAEQRRREVELQLQAVSDAAPFAMFLIARDGGRIERANAAALRQYGYSEAELIGRTADVIFSPSDLPIAPPGAERVAPLPTTARHHRSDGSPLVMEITARPIVIDRTAYDVVVAVDVTERRQLEEQYRQAQRLEAVGKLAGGIAHDFNNLLTVIGGFAAFLLEDMPQDGDGRNAATQIELAAKRASQLTRSLLAFSGRQILQATYVHLNEMVRETATMLSRLITEDIVLDLRLDATRDAVNVDPSQMQQVVINLVVNARDAMRRGGRLTIATRDLDGHVELRVSDTGTGIDPSIREHIFEPFFTTKAAGEGTGLGLPTVHGIVTQSGGRITVDSQVGGGTTFCIELPRAERAPEPEVPVASPSTRRVGKGTVMLVEDDEGVRDLASTILMRGGYKVIACANGAAALDKAASGKFAVDAVLTDVVMPGMSGPELIRRLRAYFPTMPVIYMSGYAEEATARLEIDSRTLNLLNKPFMPHELLQRVDAAIGGSSAGSASPPP